MAKGKWILSCAFVLATSSFLVAADEPKAPATQPVHFKKLTEPWSSLKTLTPDQTAQIEKIHADALEQANKIYDKETDDITAILTPAQVAELKTLQEKIKTERKEHMKKKKEPATTEPAK